MQKESTIWKLNMLEHIIDTDGIVQRRQRYFPNVDNGLHPEEECQNEVSTIEALWETCKQAEEEVINLTAEGLGLFLPVPWDRTSK